MRRMLKRGELRHVVADRLIDPESVREVLAGDPDADLRKEALEALLDGELDAPCPPRRGGRPEHVSVALLGYWLRDAVLVQHSCWPDECDEFCPKLGARFSDYYDSPWDERAWVRRLDRSKSDQERSLMA